MPSAYAFFVGQNFPNNNLPPSRNLFLGMPSHWTAEEMLNFLIEFNEQYLMKHRQLVEANPEKLASLRINYAEPLKSPLYELMQDRYHYYLHNAHNASHYVARKIAIDVHKEALGNLSPQEAAIRQLKFISQINNETFTERVLLHQRINEKELTDLELIGFKSRTSEHPFDEYRGLPYRVEVGVDLEYLPVFQRSHVLTQVSNDHTHLMFKVNPNYEIEPLSFPLSNTEENNVEIIDDNNLPQANSNWVRKLNP